MVAAIANGKYTKNRNANCPTCQVREIERDSGSRERGRGREKIKNWKANIDAKLGNRVN